MESNRPRRHILAIQASILESLTEQGATVNKIMIGANLNRKATRAYMKKLIAEGFVKIEGSGKYTTYATTQKGRTWLENYRNLISKEMPSRKHERERDF